VKASAPLSYLLLAANIIVFGLETQFSDAVIKPFALWPLGAGFEPWQLFSYAFLHGSLGHLAANMFGLWMFGRDVEGELGSVKFLQLYITSLLAAAVTQLSFAALTGVHQPTLGASGAIFGILAAFALLFPRRVIILLIPPIPLPAPLFVALYALFELYSGVSGFQAGVAHFAHLGGLAGGLWAISHRRKQVPRERLGW